MCILKLRRAYFVALVAGCRRGRCFSGLDPGEKQKDPRVEGLTTDADCNDCHWKFQASSTCDGNPTSKARCVSELYQVKMEKSTRDYRAAGPVTTTHLHIPQKVSFQEGQTLWIRPGNEPVMEHMEALSHPSEDERPCKADIRRTMPEHGDFKTTAKQPSSMCFAML